MPDGESLDKLAATGATLVLHLAITRIRAIAARLVPFYGADCPVAVVHRATQHDELVLEGTLRDIADAVEKAGLRQAAVIMVGPALRRGRPADEHVESHLYSSIRDRD